MRKITQNLRWLVTLLAMIVSSWAWATEYKLTISASDFNATSYNANNNEKTSQAVCTTDATKTCEVKWTSNQVMKNGNNMQWQKSNGYLYNTTDLGTIQSVTVTSSAGTFTTYYGTNAHPTSGTTVGNGFFTVKVGSATGTSSKVEVVFDVEVQNTVATPTITPNGGSIYTTDNIEITCETQGASIYYTIDGSTPTTNSSLYSGSFQLESDATVRAIAVMNGMTDSEVATVSFTVTEPVLPTGSSFSLYSGTLTEGDYIIYYDGKAMNKTVSSNRLSYEEVTPSDDVITTNNTSIIWHIAPSGEYWTIFNVNEGKYAASTGTKNQAQLLTSGSDDKSLWTIFGDGTYDFVNKKNTASNVNAYLRNNGTYGFACYASTTGGKLSLYKKETVAIPTFSKEEGDFTESFSLTITCDTEGATIYYTTDGTTTPSALNGTEYVNGITISATTTVKAIAIKNGESSGIASATYTKVLPSAGLEYSASSAEVTFGETPYTFPTLSNPNSVTVSYSSLNEAVAKVNANGAVSIEGIGTTTISASFGGNTEYSAGSAQYTLKVNPKISTVIDLVNNESVTFTKDKDSWTSVAGSYPTSKTEKQFIGSDGTSTTWSYKKVLKNSDKELQFKAGEGLLTSPNVDCRDGYGYKVTILFTSIASTPNASLVVTASTMETESNHAPSTGNDASLSLDVCGWSNVTISTTGTNALYVKEIKFERILVETVDVTISDKAKIDNEYYATFSNSEKALHFGAVKGLKAYIVATAEKESSAITLSEVTKVPANTGLLVCGTTPKTYKVPVISSADEILVNKLYPSTGITGDGKSIYIFANGNKGLGFYIVKNGSSLNSNQAYLKINNGTSSEIKTFFSLGGDYVNDINHIETEILSDNIGLYNLNGQRVTSPVKGGLYIMNGKKVFIK